MRQIEVLARSILPGDDAIPLNRRQAVQLDEARAAIRRAAEGHDLVLIAEDLRSARASFDRLTGRAGVEELLDALFGRFCLGK
jgi:tRNA modification GTPase